MSINYAVIIEEYTKKHYIKKFQKNYKNFWDITWKGIEEELKRFEQLLETSMTEEIVSNGDICICKTEFRVAGTKYSRKSSGNRCIVAVNKKNKKINVLLVYHKDDIGSNKETVNWKKIVRNSYDDYAFCK